MKSVGQGARLSVLIVFALISTLLSFLFPASGLADGTLSNPEFIFSKGSNEQAFKVTFTSDANAASYTVKIYDSLDNYVTSRKTVNSYVSGTDITGSVCSYNSNALADNFCYKIDNRGTFKATITANPISGVSGPGESAKSNAIGIIYAESPALGEVRDDQNQPGMYFSANSYDRNYYAASFTLYLYRTNKGLPTGSGNVKCETTAESTAELDTLYATHTGLPNSGTVTFIPLDPKYCYLWASKIIAPLTPDSSNVTWYDSGISSKYPFKRYVPQQITPPTNLVVTPSDKQLALSWTAPTGTSVVLGGYSILISTDLSTWFNVVKDGSSVPAAFSNAITSLNVTKYYYYDGYWKTHDLVNGTPYYIRIIAFGDYPDYKGSIDLYTAPNTFTPASAPMELPTGGASIGDGQVSFVWTNPTDNGGSAITGYIGQYSTDNSLWSNGFDVDASTRAASITGLTNGTPYYFRIAAKNVIGVGTYSTFASTITPVGDPSLSMSVTSIDTTTATITISGNSKGRLITPTITWKPINGNSTTVTYTATNSASYSYSLSLTGLTPGWHYQVSSAVDYTVGITHYGATAGPMDFTTTPNSVSNLSVVLGANSLIASWDAATGGGSSAYISYEVYASIGGTVKGTGCPAVIIVSGGRSSCTITGLTQTTTYDVVVIASSSGTALGNGSSTPTTISARTKTPQTITFDLSGLPTKTLDSSPFSIESYVSSTSGMTISVTSGTPSVCTISGFTVTIVAAGACGLLANQSGDSTYGAATQVIGAFSVNKRSQTITFSTSEISGKSVGSSPFPVSGSSSAGLNVVISSVTLSVCTVSSNTVTVISSGTCTLYANQSGNDSYAAASPVSQLMSISKGSQTSTIDFSGLSSKALGDSTFSISSYVTTSSGLTPTLTSDTTSVCTIATSTVTIVSAGTCTIRAAVSENANYLAATDATASFSIGKTRQTISFSLSSFTKSFGDSPFSISATSSAGLSVTLTTTSSACSISGTTLTILAGGTCTVKANQSGDDTYGPATEVSQDLVIAKIDQTITFSLSTLPSVKRADTPFSLSSYASSSSGLVVSFTSSTTSICTISGSTVTPIGVGTCTITAAQSGNSSYNPAVGVSASFVVGKTSQTISLSVPNKSYGDIAFDLSPTSTSGLTVSLTTTTAGICSISGMTVTIAAAGTCVVVANQPGNSSYSPASQISRNLIISKSDQTITFPDLPTKSYGAIAFEIPSPASSSSSLTISYASTTSSICTINGLVTTILEVGTCTISASQSGDDNYNRANSVSKSIVVSKAAQSISFPTISDHTLISNHFTATVSASSGLTVTLTSTTLSTCTVSGFVVSLVTTGTCSITASQSGDTHYSAATSVDATFSINGKIAVTLSNFPNESKTYGDSAFTISAPTASVDGTFTYTSNNTYILSISSTTATIGYVGTLTVTAVFTPTVSSSYNGASISKTFTIAQATQDPLIIAETRGNAGSTLYLSTTGGSGFGYVSYSLISSPNCTLETWGALSRTGEGDCDVVANKATDGVHTEINSAITKITFSKRSQTISFSLTSSGPQTYGSWPIWISGNSSVWLPLTFTSNDTSVCSLSGSNLSFNKPGTCSITASQSGDDTYSAATSVTSTLTVNKAPLAISFSNVDIIAGNAFDPTVIVPSFSGFVYYPSLENVSNLGGSLSCTSTYTTSSSAGDYPITCSGYTSSNYEITYGSPTLRVASGSGGGLGGGSSPGETLREQRVTFQDLSGVRKTVSDAPFSISQYASNSSPLPISFIAKSLVCTISGDVVTLVTVGTCEITAFARGNTEFSDSALVRRSFEVSIASVPTPEPMPTPTPTPTPQPTPAPEPIRVVIDPAVAAALALEAERLQEIHNKIVAAQTLITQQQKILNTVEKTYKATVLKANVAYYKELSGKRGNYKKYLALKTAAKAKLNQAINTAVRNKELTILNANKLISEARTVIKQNS